MQTTGIQDNFLLLIRGAVAQLVRVPDCRSGGCGFESRQRRLPKALETLVSVGFFYARRRFLNLPTCRPDRPDSQKLAGPICRKSFFGKPELPNDLIGRVSFLLHERLFSWFRPDQVSHFLQYVFGDKTKWPISSVLTTKADCIPALGIEPSALTDKFVVSTMIPVTPFIARDNKLELNEIDQMNDRVQHGSEIPPPGRNVKRLPVAPVTLARRIVAIDVLRGFALLGILVMNIQSFAMVDAALLNPYALGKLEGGDFWVWLFGHVFADMKMMGLFSLLFGAGIILMTERGKQAGWLAGAGLHYRRMFWLLLFGMAHAYLLWPGDILVTYALCGSFVFLFRKLPPWWLLSIGLLLLSVGSSLSILAGWSMPFWPEEAIADFKTEWSPSQATIKEQLAIYRGSWLSQLPHRAEDAFFVQTFLFLFLFGWRASGLMLFGMALYRLGIINGKRSFGFYLALAVAGLTIGLSLILIGVSKNLACEFNLTYSFFLGTQFNYWGSLFVCLSYIGLIMLICKLPNTWLFTRPLARVGQMALTNYLMQTIICTTVFYGHGLGFFGYFSRVQQILFVFGVWIFQFITSMVWLEYFKFGPFEWVWRSLTYWRLQPMRLSNNSAEHL